MKLMIDITEVEFNACKRVVEAGVSDWQDKVIANGTPLPKGHGRLIDVDEIRFENADFDTYGDYCIAFDAIENAPTIIEVDKGGEE